MVSCVPEVGVGREGITNGGRDFDHAVGVVEGVGNDEDAEELGVHCEHEGWV